MRNLFDQYSHPENRVTHALASALYEDRRLLKRFLSWIVGAHPSINQIEIVEQRLPGDLQYFDDTEKERSGLPDIWIHDNDHWSLLIESKISSSINTDQLRRHLVTAQRRGFSDVNVVGIDVTPPRRKLPEWASYRSWSEVYQWLRKQAVDSEWAVRVSDYFEVAEARLAEEGYLKEGTLTVFSGIPFDEKNLYNYPEAKRVLKLMMAELRERKDLQRILRIDPVEPGRGAITGKYNNGVWDFLWLKDIAQSQSFTNTIHLTVFFGRDSLSAAVIIPNGISAIQRANLKGLDRDKFFELMFEVNTNLVKGLRGAKGSAPWVNLEQRRYPSRSASAIEDAKLAFDLRTAFVSKRKGAGIKTQPQWLNAVYDALTNKKSNMQASVGAYFPYRYCKMTKNPEIVDYIAASWIACKPLIDKITSG